MGRAFEEINEPMQRFIEAQQMFFVATAPSADGRVNLSPKGYDSFAVLSPNRVAYLDLTGSGVETVAHVRQNGRITFMFCAFEGKPNIVRLYGTGRVVTEVDDEFDSLIGHFSGRPAGLRSIIVADIDRTSNSCGFAVPFMDYVEDRQKLADHWTSRGPDVLPDYWAEKNATSIDGLPGF